MKKKLSHIDAKGAARMVDVGGKEQTPRIAMAQCVIKMKSTLLKDILKRKNRKGDVFQVARIAGIQGAKETSRLIPLCHTLALTRCEVDFEQMNTRSIRIISRVESYDRTGVEMEALTSVAVAGLTVYDMCKSADKSIEITDMILLEKSGGKSGNYRRVKQRKGKR